jgi:hypothetical protein
MLTKSILTARIPRDCLCKASWFQVVRDQYDCSEMCKARGFYYRAVPKAASSVVGS